MTIVLSPSDRFSIIGKTGSGKTMFSVVLASLLVLSDEPTWQAWWIDSKLDPQDQSMLRKWGFGRTRARRLFPIHQKDGDISDQVQDLCARALARKHVLVVIDEYKHVVKSTRRAGDGIQGIHLRGRGLNVGLLGQTQEPVDIPRQLLSQATHSFLFDMSYPQDIRYIRSMCEQYRRPLHRHGFLHSHIDGDAIWRYYPHVRAWHDTVARLKQTAVR